MSDRGGQRARARRCRACRRTRMFVSTLRRSRCPTRSAPTARPTSSPSRALHPDDRAGPGDRPGHLGAPRPPTTRRSRSSATAATSASTPARPAVGLLARHARRSSGCRGPPQGLRPGDTWDLPGGGSITYAEHRGVGDLPGHPGPGQAARARRRRRHGPRPAAVAVRPPPAAVGAGHPGRRRGRPGPYRGRGRRAARTDPEAFATEFAELTARLRAAHPPAARPHARRQEE